MMRGFHVPFRTTDHRHRSRLRRPARRSGPPGFGRRPGPRPQPAGQRSAVVLGAIQYDSPGRDNGSNRSLNAEWVTVTNTGRHSVNLRGWTLSDESNRTYRFDLRLPGRSSVRVHTGVGRDTARDVYQDRRNYVWDSRDTATLRDNRGRKIDSESWGRHHGGNNHGHGGSNGHQGGNHNGHNGHNGGNSHGGGPRGNR